MGTLLDSPKRYPIHFPNIARVAPPEVVALVKFFGFFPDLVDLEAGFSGTSIRFDVPQDSFVLVSQLFLKGHAPEVTPDYPIPKDRRIRIALEILIGQHINGQ